MFSPFWKGVVFMLGGVLMLLWAYGWMPSAKETPLPQGPTTLKVVGWLQILISVFYLFVLRG